jgi:hypothetical protein
MEQRVWQMQDEGDKPERNPYQVLLLNETRFRAKSGNGQRNILARQKKSNKIGSWAESISQKVVIL